MDSYLTTRAETGEGCVRVSAQMVRRPWRGNEGLVGADKVVLIKCAMDTLAYTEKR